MARSTIALGSNLGNRLAHLQKARDCLKTLARPGTFLQSPVYQTTPLQCPDQSPDFFNAVVDFHYEGSHQQLLSHTQAIEFHLGRTAAAEANAPRIIDIDLLLFDDLIYNDGLLETPHPRLLYRRFVLEPLADIRPEARLPQDHLTIRDHLQHFETTEPPLILVQAIW